MKKKISRKQRSRFLPLVFDTYVTDSHGFLWFLAKDERIGKRALEVFCECDHEKEVVVIPIVECLSR